MPDRHCNSQFGTALEQASLFHEFETIFYLGGKTRNFYNFHFVSNVQNNYRKKCTTYCHVGGQIGTIDVLAPKSAYDTIVMLGVKLGLLTS